MTHILESKISELEERLNSLRDKLDSTNDNNYHEQSRIQLQIGEAYKQLSEAKRSLSLFRTDKYTG